VRASTSPSPWCGAPGSSPHGRTASTRAVFAGAGAAGGLWLHEEEVPRAGAAVARGDRHARWHDGSVHVWTGRAKRTGGGEGSSGLRFDTLDP